MVPLASFWPGPRISEIAPAVRRRQPDEPTEKQKGQAARARSRGAQSAAVCGARCRGRLLGPVLIAAATAAMVYWSWGTWPDVIVDFGRELYTPWQLSEGQVLYRDVAHFNGPLSPYINALWFRLFGVGLRTLVVANLAIFGVLLYLCYSLLVQLGSRTSATLACLVFVFVFAFSRYTIAGNYNYLCPYSHEATHGLTLAVASFYFLALFARQTIG